MKQEPISCRADNALAAHCQSFVARWACVLKRLIFYLAAYIDNNGCYGKYGFQLNKWLRLTVLMSIFLKLFFLVAFCFFYLVET